MVVEKKMTQTHIAKNRDRKTESEMRIMELKTKHPGEWVLILKDDSRVHAEKLQDAYARVADVSKIKTTLRPYKPQELLLY